MMLMKTGDVGNKGIPKIQKIQKMKQKGDARSFHSP